LLKVNSKFQVSTAATRLDTENRDLSWYLHKVTIITIITAII